MNFMKTILKSFIPLVTILLVVLGIVFYLEKLAYTYSEQPTYIDIKDKSDTTDASDINDEAMTKTRLYQTLKNKSEFKEALVLYESKKYSAAFTAFQVLQDSYADNPYLPLYLGLCLDRQGEYEKAVTYFKHATEFAPQFQSAYVYWAICVRKMNRYDDAVALLKKAIEINEAYVFALYQLGVTWNAMDVYDSAVVVFLKALERAPTGSKARISNRLGEAYALSRKNKDAEKAFLKAIEYDPDFLQPRINMARLYPASGKSLEKRKELLQEILALNPHYAPAYYELGKLASEAKDYFAAERYLNKAVIENPLDNRARAEVGLLNLEQGRVQEAEQVFRDLLAEDSLLPQNYFYLAKFYDQKQDYQTSIQFYNKAIQRANNYYPEAWLNRGVSYERYGLLDSAIASYETALLFRKDYHEAFYNIGRLHMKKGSIPKAVDHFRKACVLRQDYHAAWYNLGLLYGNSGKIDSSIACYRRALSIKPDYVKARLNLAVKLTDAGDTVNTLHEYKLLTSQHPEYTPAWFNLARLLTRLSRYEQAVEAYLKLLQIDPENNKARQNLGVLYSRLNRSRDAVSVYREALEQEPGNVDIRFNLAVQYQRTQQPDKAMEDFEKSLRLDPKFVKSWTNLMELYATEKTTKRAKRFFLEVKPPEKISYNLGKYYFAIGDYSTAIRLFDKAIKTYKYPYRVYYWSGKSHRKLGNLTEAIQLLKTSVKLKPGYFYGWKQLGMAYKENKETINALHALKRARDLKSEDAEVRNLIKALSASGEI